MLNKMQVLNKMMGKYRAAAILEKVKKLFSVFVSLHYFPVKQLVLSEVQMQNCHCSSPPQYIFETTM